MQKTKVFLTIASLLLSVQVFAGGDFVGNGGDGVWCENKVPFQLKVLDEFEGDTYFDNKWQDVSGSNYIEMAKNHIDNNMGQRSPLLRSQIKKFINEFANNQIILSGMELPNVQDSDHFTLPHGCEIRQLVIRNDKSTNFLKKIKQKYIISGFYWQKLTEIQKTILVLHEALYEVGIVYGDFQNSEEVRFFNTHVYSNKLSNKAMTDSQYHQLLSENLGYKNYESTNFLLSKPEFYESGRIAKGLVAMGKPNAPIETDHFTFSNLNSHKNWIFNVNNGDLYLYLDTVILTNDDKQKIAFLTTRFSTDNNQICEKSSGRCVSRLKDFFQSRYYTDRSQIFVLGARSQFHHLHLANTLDSGELRDWYEQGGFDKLLKTHFQLIAGKTSFNCKTMQKLGLPNSVKIKLGLGERPNLAFEGKWQYCN